MSRTLEPLPMSPADLAAILASLIPKMTAAAVVPPGAARTPYKVWGLGSSPKPYDLNIYLIRSSDRKADTFDDVAVFLYRDEKLNWVVTRYRVTTTPGASALAAPMRTSGTAIVCPGYYQGCWKPGLHKGNYPALVQARDGAFYGWRDPNKDAMLDTSGTVYNDLGGINFHGAGDPESIYVGGWSAGCTVNAVWKEHLHKMELTKLQVKHTGVSTFSAGFVDVGAVPELAFLLK